MVPTDDENLQILDRSFDVFAEFATKIRYANCALTTLEQLTTIHLLNQILSVYDWLLLRLNSWAKSHGQINFSSQITLLTSSLAAIQNIFLKTSCLTLVPRRC